MAEAVINVVIKSLTPGSPKRIHALVLIQLIYLLIVNITETLPLGKEADP